MRAAEDVSEIHSPKIFASLFVFNNFGDVAQLGERCNGIAEVRGSIPLVSTNKQKKTASIGCLFYCLPPPHQAEKPCFLN